ncbi:hypothetical protein GCM10027447_37450 [Glycomyces halotolerans]
MGEPSRVLIILDKAYRGGLEAQFVDALYFVRELNRQLGDLGAPEPRGGLDVYLTGLAVTYALDQPAPPEVHLADMTVDTLPDPRSTIRALIGEDVGVWADGDERERLSKRALIPGVRPVAPTAMTLRWPEYRHVWFL